MDKKRNKYYEFGNKNIKKDLKNDFFPFSTVQEYSSEESLHHKPGGCLHGFDKKINYEEI